MPEPLQARIAEALRRVVNPRTGEDVVRAEMVRDIATTLDGKVRLTVLLGAQDPASLVREVRHAVEQVDGVSDVRVDVKDPGQLRAARAGAGGATSAGGPAGAGGAGGAGSASSGTLPGGHAVPPHAPGPAGEPAHGHAPGAGRALPVMNQEPARRPVPPAPTPVAYPNLGRVIAVSSGKGGVGKTTVAVNVAIALARAGSRVGLMDADIYGPNVPRMMGVDEPPPVVDNKIMPLEAYGVKLMSLGFLVERDQPAIWRGPIVMKIVTQFLRDVHWGELDYLLVDMPPGTGDAQLSLVQATHVTGAVIVTTPQPVATGDALRGAKMFERVNVPVLGIVENMSWLPCPHCGKPTALFGSGGGRQLADELRVPLLGEIPIQPDVRIGGDEGEPIVVRDPDSPAGKALGATAVRIAEAVEATAGV